MHRLLFSKFILLSSFFVFVFYPSVSISQTCPDLKVGDLFKVPNNSAVYALDDNLNRLYFPNSEVFYTWYDDFSSVVEIPNICVDNYPIPSSPPYGINFRPGSKLVKITISPSVYVIEPNNTLRRITSESVARDLYGSNWASFVRDVPDVFWSNYKNRGENISESIPHNGMVVQKSGSADTYYVEDNILKKLSGGQEEDVRIISSSVFESLSISSSVKDSSTLYYNPPQRGKMLVVDNPIAETNGNENTSGLVASYNITPEGIINWTNYYRELSGLNALVVNEKLTNMAKAKILDQYTREYSGHGEGPGVLAEAEGYEYIKLGENIIHYPEMTNPIYTDKYFVEQWIASPGHCANIYGANFTEIGVALGDVFDAYKPGEWKNIMQQLGTPKSVCEAPDESLAKELELSAEELDIYISRLNNMSESDPEYVSLVNEYNTLVDEHNANIVKYNNQLNVYNACLKKLTDEHEVVSSVKCG
jgi:uncharacterized protein YkwD